MTTKSKKSIRTPSPVNMGEYSQMVMELGTDFGNRHMYMTSPIDEDSLYTFIVNFRIMDAYPGDISITLCSPGGSESIAWAIFDLIKASNNKVIVIGVGEVQSAAALIIQAADVRLMMPECRFMIHNGSLNICGSINADTFTSLGEETRNGIDRCNRVTADRSGLSVDLMSAMFQKETYLSAKEAVKFGLIDAILMYNGDCITKKDLEAL